MFFKILQFLILASTFSLAQINEYEELFNFSFGSSKEEVKKIWKETSYAKIGDLVLSSDDALQIRIDDFKYFDGWQFLFIKDSLYKIQMFSKIIESKCLDVIEWFKTNYGEPEISSGIIYYWKYGNGIDATVNKISLSCSCFICEQIPDSARLVIGIVNDKLYKRFGDLTVNKEFLNGVKNFLWKSSSENILKQILQKHNMQLLPEREKNIANEKLVYARYGYFASMPVNEWCFTFYEDKLYKIEINFESKMVSDKNIFHTVYDSINKTYARCYDNFLQGRKWYSWYFNNYDEQQSIFGKIYLEEIELKGIKSEVILTFEYLRRTPYKEQ
jgi:hypothetical protein